MPAAVTPNPKILCVGLGKTGTKTLATCLRTLGFHHLSMHGTSEYASSNHTALLEKAKAYDSFDDFPWAYLHEMFEDHFPNTRFILTRRKDVDTWYDSLCRHYCRVGPSFAKRVFYGHYSPYQNPDYHRSLYLNHNEKIRRHFQGNPNFLEVCWEEGDGWDELCSFLNLPVPDIPFPARNVGKVDFDYAAGKRRADGHLERLMQAGANEKSIDASGASAVATPSALDPQTPSTQRPRPPRLKPRMLEDEIDLFRTYLENSSRFLEFGSGGSTLLALQSGVAKCHTVETDREWIRKLRRIDDVRTAESSGRLSIHPANVGPTRAWGIPSDRSRIAAWPKYFLDVWSELDRVPDTVLIDGRFRTACALVTLLVCPRSTAILIHDFYSEIPMRRNYPLLLEVAEVVDRRSDLVCVRRKESVAEFALLPYLSKVLFDFG